MKFSEVLAQLGNAGAIAARAASDYSLQRLRDAFEDHDGVLKPKVLKLELGQEEPVDIPEYSLVRPGGLDLDELRVEFEVEADFSQIGESQMDSAIHVDQVQIKPKRGLLQRNTHMTVTCVFKMGPRPEAAEVVNDQLVDHLREKIQ